MEHNCKFILTSFFILSLFFSTKQISFISSQPNTNGRKLNFLYPSTFLFLHHFLSSHFSLMNILTFPLLSWSENMREENKGENDVFPYLVSLIWFRRGNTKDRNQREKKSTRAHKFLSYMWSLSICGLYIVIYLWEVVC